MGSKPYGNGISSHRPCSLRAHISGHGLVSGLLGRGVSLTISPVCRSVQVLPAAFCIEPAGQGLALADPEAEADDSRSRETEAEADDSGEASNGVSVASTLGETEEEADAEGVASG